MESLCDQDLLKQLSGGSQAAFSIIYKRYWKKVFKFAYDRLGDRKQSQDIVQDIFANLWEKREKLRINNLNAYLFASACYVILRSSNSELAKNKLFASLQRLTPETAAPADDPLISAELLDAYHELVEKMPQRRRTILRMHYEENLKTRQIAESLNISQKTVQNQLLTSYAQIRELLSRVLLFSLMCVYLLLSFL